MRWFEAVFSTKVSHWLGRHVMFWLGYLVFFTFIHSPRVGDLMVSFQTALLHLPHNILLVYLMIYGLIPKLLAGKYRQFLAWLGAFLLLGLLGNYLFRAFVLIPFRTGKPTPIFNGSLNKDYLTIFTVGGFIYTQSIVWIAAGIKLLRYWYQKERITQQLTNETLTIELQMLKAQIHPHFLFNTLNNLYSLTLKQSSKAPDTVLKLSGLLHYMLHECNKPTVPLTQEIAFLNNYIELEKLRYGNRLLITITVEGDSSNRAIAPLLLIPFLENAFKHGTSQQTDQARIDLLIQVQDHTMTFRLENSTDQTAPYANPIMTNRPGHNRMGIGLANVRKRLLLIYPDAHTVDTQLDHGRFMVDLTLTLTDVSHATLTSPPITA